VERDALMKPDADGAKKLVGALLRMPPKPHSEMKLHKPKAKPVKSPVRKRGRGASAKLKTA
jgi:hypothetical protein